MRVPNYKYMPGYYDAFGVYRRTGNAVLSKMTDAQRQEIIDYWRLERNNTDAELAAAFNLPQSVIVSIIDGYIKTLKIGFKK